MQGIVHPRDVVMLTRDRIQETLDAATARGRVTRKDANDLVAELVRRGRAERDDLRGGVEKLIERGRGQLETTGRRSRSAQPGDRAGGNAGGNAGQGRSRRGVPASFPIQDYEGLTALQVQSRVKELSRPDRRKVLNYERKHANRKSVVGAIEKSLT